MTSSESRPAPTAGERRMRWIAAASLIILVPATIAATGWRDWREVRRAEELTAIDVPAGGSADYNGARITLAGTNFIPLEPGLPADRTFLRTRLIVEPHRAGTRWLGCTLNVIDAHGRAWSAIDGVPSLVERTLAKPGEEPGTICTGLSVANAKPGSKVAIDAYYLVPRPVLSSLRVTISTMAGRPAYLRFAAEGKR